MASFGENLRTQRELRGVSLREIAEGTKISLRFLQALEEDRLDLLPGGLFPRSFVRQYAQFIGLDPERTTADFVASHREVPLERRPPVPGLGRKRLSLGHLFLVAVAVAATLLILRRPEGEDEGTPRPAPAARAVVPTAVPNGRVEPPPPVEPVVSAAPDGLILMMTAQQDCWVEVRADGETVINRVLAEGESQTLEARGEIVLSVGNAGGLTLRVNDRPTLPLGRSGEVRKNIVITRQNLPSLVERDGASAGDGHSG